MGLGFRVKGLGAGSQDLHVKAFRAVKAPCCKVVMGLGLLPGQPRDKSKTGHNTVEITHCYPRLPCTGCLEPKTATVHRLYRS